MILKRVTKDALTNKWKTLLVFGKEDIGEIDNLVKYLTRSVDILIIVGHEFNPEVIGKLAYLLSLDGKTHSFKDMKKELLVYEYNDVYSWKLKTLLIVPPKVVKKKTLFIGYNVDTLLIPKNLKELDKENTLEKYVFPIMKARKGTEIIYL